MGRARDERTKAEYLFELIRFEIGTEEATTVDRSRGLVPLPGMMSRDGRWITRMERGASRSGRSRAAIGSP
jgi:hypothetical protein